MADAIQNLISELRNFKHSEAAQFTRFTVENMVAAWNQTDAAIGGITAQFSYSTGPWTPVDASGANLVFTGVQGFFTQIGNMCFARALLNYPATANALANAIGGLPFPIINGTSAFSPSIVHWNGTLAAGTVLMALGVLNSSTLQIVNAGTAGVTPLTNAQLTGAQLIFDFAYPIAFT